MKLTFSTESNEVDVTEILSIHDKLEIAEIVSRAYKRKYGEDVFRR